MAHKNDLERGLTSDLAKAEGQRRQQRSALGVKGGKDTLAGRTTEVKAKAKTSATLSQIDRAINKASRQLTREANFTDMTKARIFENGMRNKLRGVRFKLMEAAGKAKILAARQGKDAEKDAGLLQGIFGIGQTIGFGLMSGAGKTPDSTDTGLPQDQPASGGPLGDPTRIA